jgi:hypothetical protein
VKIAVCLSGQPRNFREGHSYFSRAFASHEVDYFVHHWFHNDEMEDPVFILSGGVNERKVSWVPEEDTDKKMIELFEPKSYLFEKRKEFPSYDYPSEFKLKDGSLGVRGAPVPDSLSMLYSRNECGKLFDAHLKENNTKYDFAIWTRPDVAVLCESSFWSKLNKATDWNFIHTAYEPGEVWNNGAVNTSLIASSPSNISYFLKLYDHYKALIEEGVPFCDHLLAFAHLKKLKQRFMQILVTEDLNPQWAWIRNGELKRS